MTVRRAAFSTIGRVQYCDYCRDTGRIRRRRATRTRTRAIYTDRLIVPISKHFCDECWERHLPHSVNASGDPIR